MKRILLLSCILITAACETTQAADWLTGGGDPQRTNWQRDEHILSKENVKDLKILWKLKLDNQPREMHSLFPPLLVSDVQGGPAGAREIAIVAGISDNVYGINAENGTLLWKTHFDYPPPKEGTGFQAGDPLCPGGQTAIPVVGAPDKLGKRTLYALAGDGQLHFLNVADGKEICPPVKFGFANSKAYALNLWNGLLYTTTSQSCNGSPNQVWALDVNNPSKVMTFNPRSGGLWGREGAAIDSSGVAWAPTGDGTYEPESFTFGNGLIGVRVNGNQLQLEDWFEPKNWFWMSKRDLDMQVTPAIFNAAGRELLATASKACRVYLLDTKAAGGEDHQTPLAETPLMCNEEVNFASAGIWGSLATWEDSSGTRWLLSPFWGPVHPKFDVPVSYGPVTNGAIVALKVKPSGGGDYALTPGWMSRDMQRAEPPVVANGVVYAFGSGENTEQAYRERGLFDYSPERIKNSTHATLYALDAETGKELYSSGNEIKTFVHFGGLSVANGRVYLGTYDSILYCFGLPGK